MFFFLLFFAALLFPGIAFAHVGQVGGFMAGLMHPVVGLDHLLAMVSVGIVSAQMGGRAIWSVPAAFVCVMGIGGFVGMQSYAFLEALAIITIIERGIIASVILLGLAIALDKKMPVWMAMLACGFFGFFHGFAHGTEIPDLVLSATYIGGFMLSTAFLHIAGVGIGEIARRVSNGTLVLRYIGAVILGMGLHIAYEAVMFEMAFAH